MELLEACSNGDTKLVVNFLLCSFTEINYTDTIGWTPLIYASERGSIDIVKILLKYPNINYDSKSKCGRTALHYAYLNNHFIVSRELIMAGADISAIVENGILRLIDGSYFIPYIDVRYILKELIKAGANVNIINKDGNTVLIIAVMHNDIELVKEILKAGANTYTKDSKGRTALDIALRCNFTKIAKEIIIKELEFLKRVLPTDIIRHTITNY